MKDGKCPMCNSTKVYTNSEVIFTDSPDSANPPDAGLYDSENDMQIYLAPYICVSCGFTAFYAHDMDVVKDIPDADGWEKVK